jgi:hypothetical protein
MRVTVLVVVFIVFSIVCLSQQATSKINNSLIRANQAIIYQQLQAMNFESKTSCSKTKTSFACCVGPVEVKLLLDIKYNITACMAGSVDWPTKSVDFKLTFNNETVLEKKVALDDLKIGLLCVPVLDKFQIKLCIFISDIKLSLQEECFSAAASLGFKFLFFPELTIINPIPFGYHADKCNYSQDVSFSIKTIRQ